MPPRTEAGLLDALSAAPPPAGRAEQATAALAEAVAGLSPGWIALEGCLLPAEGALPAGRIRHALLHPAAGIALLELAPGDIAPDAAGRLTRLLDAAGFTPRFGGLPPILHLHVPQRLLPTLGWVIEEQFGRHPALALTGGTAWVAATRRLLAGAALMPRPDATAERAGPGGWWQGGRLLAGIWGGLALLVGSLVLVLQLLGPPEPEAEFAAGFLPPATRPDPVPEPQAVASVPPDQAQPDPAPPDLATSPAWPEVAEEGPAVAPPWVLATMPPAETSTPPDPVAAAPEPAVPVAPAQEPMRGAPIVAEPEAPELAALDPPAPALLAPEPRASGAPAPDSPTPALLDVAPAPAMAEAAMPEPVVPEPQAMEAARPEPAPPTPAPVIAEAIAPDSVVAVPQPASPSDAATATPAPMALLLPGSSPVADETGSPGPEAMAATSGAEPTPAATPAPLERESPATTAPADHPPAASPAEPPLPVAPPPAPPVVLSRPATPPAAGPLPALVLRADEMLRLGDISAARRLYERAATAGNGQAALALGRTHDPAFLAAIHARGIQGDRATAIIWYRRALELGVAEAREPLVRLGALPGE
jgi:hypothetical protein